MKRFFESSGGVISANIRVCTCGCGETLVDWYQESGRRLPVEWWAEFFSRLDRRGGEAKIRTVNLLRE